MDEEHAGVAAVPARRGDADAGAAPVEEVDPVAWLEHDDEPLGLGGPVGWGHGDRERAIHHRLG
jgi:hypothetical protein